MHRYETVIYWSEEDQLYIAKVPDLPGCMAHGKTDMDALLNSKDAIDLWISTAREFGDPVPAPTGHSVKFR